MKKRIYDFSIATAVIVLLGYAVVLMISIYAVVNNEDSGYGSIIFLSLLVASLIFVVIYYGIFSIKVTDEEVRHRNKKISKNNLTFEIRRNYRLKYDELILRDKSIHYDRLSKREVVKHEIAVQYFLKYEEFLQAYLNHNELPRGED